MVILGNPKKTLYYGWHEDQSYPKDYDPYKELGGSLFRSTYDRLGTWSGNEMYSTTKEDMKRALELRTDSPVSSGAFNSGVLKQRKKARRKGKTEGYKAEYDPADHATIYKSEFINFYPDKYKPLKIDITPEAKYRRLLVDGADPRRPGINMFHDDNMDHLLARVKDRPPPPYELYPEDSEEKYNFSNPR